MKNNITKKLLCLLSGWVVVAIVLMLTTPFNTGCESNDYPPPPPNGEASGTGFNITLNGGDSLANTGGEGGRVDLNVATTGNIYFGQGMPEGSGFMKPLLT